MNYQENQAAKRHCKRDKRVQHRMRGDCKNISRKINGRRFYKNPGKLKIIGTDIRCKT